MILDLSGSRVDAEVTGTAQTRGPQLGMGLLGVLLLAGGAYGIWRGSDTRH
jgi:hypothetical protein